MFPPLGIFSIVLVRSKGQDDIDKKPGNHHQLPLDYVSNEVHAMDTTPIVKTLQNNGTLPSCLESIGSISLNEFSNKTII